MRATSIMTWAALVSLLSLYPATARGDALKVHLNAEQLHILRTEVDPGRYILGRAG